MKNLLLFTFILAIFTSFSFGATSLQQVYSDAQPGLGYDRLLILHPDSMYSGGISVTNEKIGIKGYGAIIDLAGDSINVSGESQIDIDGCVIINGGSAVAAHGTVNGLITQCTFYGNQIGIHFMSSGCMEVMNTIISNNSRYGYACDETSVCILHYLDSYQNSQGNFMEWCSG
jgi:nitrous oxidase accessory protein NosD